MHTFIESEPGLWTVGHYDPDGGWHPESDHGDDHSAMRRVVELNGGAPERSSFVDPAKAKYVIDRLTAAAILADQTINSVLCGKVLDDTVLVAVRDSLGAAIREAEGTNLSKPADAVAP